MAKKQPPKSRIETTGPAKKTVAKSAATPSAIRHLPQAARRAKKAGRDHFF